MYITQPQRPKSFYGYSSLVVPYLLPQYQLKRDWRVSRIWSTSILFMIYYNSMIRSLSNDKLKRCIQFCAFIILVADITRTNAMYIPLSNVQVLIRKTKKSRCVDSCSVNRWDRLVKMCGVLQINLFILRRIYESIVFLLYN